MNQLFFFVKEQYFIDHSSFQKMLDPNNTAKQSRRTYICIKIVVDGNTFYLPLRNNLGSAIRAFGRIGHTVPSQKRPNAGIDYRYTLVINDNAYIEQCSMPKLPKAQSKKIIQDYADIQNEFLTYLRGYKKAALKNRLQYEPLYRESSLINFNNELGLNT